MPLQMLEATDPLTDLITFKASAVHELVISLHTLLQPGRHRSWVEQARTRLSPTLWQELGAVYEPFYKGAVFFELAVDYPDHEDVPGFIEYVRRMDPVMFIFYVLGRILTPDEIAGAGLDKEALIKALLTSQHYMHCLCAQSPLEQILADIPAFQNRLADLWWCYWDECFRDVLDDLRPHWQRALDEHAAILERLGGQAFLEYVTGKQELPAPLPPDQPVVEITFIPLYLLPASVYIFYGYGNVTVLFYSERTEARATELEQAKQRLLILGKALSDSTRLDILRLIAHSKGTLHGKKIAEKLNMSAPTVSRHLSQLKEAGLITEKSADNRTITYDVDSEAVNVLTNELADYLTH